MRICRTDASGWVHGEVSSTSADTIRLRGTDGDSLAIATSDIRVLMRSEGRQRFSNAVLGGLFGGGGAALAGFLIGEKQSHTRPEAAYAALNGAVIGAAVGAVGGAVSAAILAPERWSVVSLSPEPNALNVAESDCATS